jgi:pimeloyl-ACP methyl ester carboxylesterase
MPLVHGDVSAGGMVGDEDAAAFRRSAPDGRVVKIAGGSHALHRDSTDAFLAAALPFLRENAA